MPTIVVICEVFSEYEMSSMLVNKYVNSLKYLNNCWLYYIKIYKANICMYLGFFFNFLNNESSI